MSAPKTDLDKQKRRHWGPLLGMRAVVLWALVLLALLIVYLFARGDTPGDEAQPAPTPIEDATPVPTPAPTQ